LRTFVLGPPGKWKQATLELVPFLSTVQTTSVPFIWRTVAYLTVRMFAAPATDGTARNAASKRNAAAER
jgi:hypothetical protein